MFNQQESYAAAMVVALAAAVVLTLFALAHALHGFQTFW